MTFNDCGAGQALSRGPSGTPDGSGCEARRRPGLRRRDDARKRSLRRVPQPQRRTSTPSCSFSLSRASVFASSAEFVCDGTHRREGRPGRGLLRGLHRGLHREAHLQKRASGLDAVIKRTCQLRHPRQRAASTPSAAGLLWQRLRWRLSGLGLLRHQSDFSLAQQALTRRVEGETKGRCYVT